MLLFASKERLLVNDDVNLFQCARRFKRCLLEADGDHERCEHHVKAVGDVVIMVVSL